ncbi:hypothetical protein [Pseudomonas taiwanensis]|uniref:Uncharacterized protein n=1 Tax=Pseudomonas taiwanensis TaxID=470150 RepID=A0ABR6V5F4_9PSED|nr:hypothetical protein [Pseudomonas taiwanensis]MBC3475712.1 hypothetical protein [Pseudomonas taiwanensis]
MLKASVLSVLCQREMPIHLQRIIDGECSKRSDYGRKIDKRLSVTYPVFLDIYGLAPGVRRDELDAYEFFMLHYTDDSVDVVRAQSIRLAEITEQAGNAVGARTSLSFDEWKKIAPSLERLSFYNGWFLPTLGQAGQFVNLLDIYNRFGADFCGEVYSELAIYLDKVNPKTARMKVNAMLVVNGILADTFEDRYELKHEFKGRVVVVLEKSWIHFRCRNFNRLSEVQFYEAIRILNDFYIGRGFIERLEFPLDGRIAKVLLGDKIKGRRFS